jgi:hypothetical protein
VLQYDRQVIAIGPFGDRSFTRPCCVRIPAGYAFAVFPPITLIRSSWFMNVASDAHFSERFLTTQFRRHGTDAEKAS